MPNDAPPVEAAYQSMVPALEVAPKLTAPMPQRLSGVVLLMVGMVFTVAITSVRMAVVQPISVASTQYDVVVAILGVV